MKTATLGIYSVDPPALDAFHSFDPESFVTLLAISDALIAIGPEGDVEPSLATAWERTSPLTMEFQLREGVRFHNGEPFDADSVVATFRAHHEPTPSACGGGILSVITDVRKLGPFRVELTTAFPDAMLLRRLFFFSVYPRGVLETEGRGAMLNHPIGTGAWRFVHWKKGEEIRLARNEDHWRSVSSVDQIRIPIIRQKEWVDRLQRGEMDVVLNIDSHDAVRAGRAEGVEVGSREAALSQWFLLANKGPLADVRVRQALNHAIKRSLIAEVSEHGLASAQRSVATAESLGHTDDVTRYRYSPELARRILADAGYPDGFTLNGLVSETSTGVYFAVREFLGRVGVTLEATIVPRAQWIGRVVGGNLTQQPYDGDFALSIVDNPLLDSIFHQFIFLFSQGLFSLTRDDAYDQAFLKAATAIGDEATELAARQELERYAVEQALVLFTVQQQVHAAWREGSHVKMPRSGHFDSCFWWDLDVPDQGTTALRPVPNPDQADMRALLDGTSHAGTFFLPPDHRFSEPWAAHLWQSLQTSETRWRLAHEPMIKELVTQIEARNHLSSILSSTQRVAIIGYNLEDQQRFANTGFQRMFGDTTHHISTLLDSPSWEDIARGVAEEGSWLGPVTLERGLVPEDTAEHLYLTATPSLDDEGASTGITLVFSDFSGEEERIRNQAVQVILDNVPYGLLVVGGDGLMRSGSSDACRALFPGLEETEGVALAAALQLDERDADDLNMAIEQVFDDWMPEEVSLDQIPSRVPVGERTLSLSASVVRTEQGAVDGLLFTVADISELIEAEREVERIRCTLKVLRFRDRFEGFVGEFAQDLAQLEADTSAAGWQDQARRVLHTGKGVFGQFGLRPLQEFIHELESSPEIGLHHIRQTRTALQVELDQRAEVWGVKLSGAQARYEVDEEVLSSLAAAVDDAGSLQQARQAVHHLLEAVRCKPAHLVLGPIESTIQQLAASSGKQIRTVLNGMDHRLPTRLGPVFDQLGHLVRNAVDHGIEVPEARGAKPESATVTIGVHRVGAAWHLVVSDDGAGIDGERVASKAVKMGLLSAEQAAALSPQQKVALIFADGLSTAETVSDTSGRGVGMAAVRALVESMGGRLQIESVIGEGTTTTLILPDVVDAPASAAA